jgi:hypothetical protein
MRRRRDQLHGVAVRKHPQGSPVDPRASEVLIRRICIRYEDGRRVCFVPEAENEFSSRDDMRRVVGMLHIGGPRGGADGAGEVPWHGAIRHRRRLTSRTPTGANNEP